MRDLDNLCSNCFQELTQGSVCAQCGHDNDAKNDTMYLSEKTVLQGKYVIGAVKEHQSDAVNYAGYDSQLDQQIIIREFYPQGIANRFDATDEIHIRQKFTAEYNRYKQDFINLWTTMEKLHSLSAVVPVYDVFEENGTAYAIIEFMDTIPLREYLLRNKEGYILWDSARLMFMPVLTTIEALHNNGIIHGSITPDSLVLCRDGKVRLAPFPISASTDISSILQTVVNDGYTALEQYDNGHKICPATDIYSFSACIYRALVGTNPADAPAREINDKLMIPNSIAESIPIHVIKALGNGLQIYPEKRIATIAEFRDLLDAAPAVQAKAAEPIEDIYQEGAKGGYPDYAKIEQDEKKKKSKTAVTVLLILVIIAVCTAIYVVKFSGLVNTNKETTTTTQVAQYEVPNFVNNGYTQSDVESNGAWNEQFKIEYQYEYSADAEEGIVFKQSVDAGTKINSGSQIILTVSKGIQTETVPNVGGLSVEEATQKLEALGFKVSTVQVYNDGTHQPNTVKASYGMAPEAESVIAVGEEIILQVYGEVQTTTQPETTLPESTTAGVSVKAGE